MPMSGFGMRWRDEGTNAVHRQSRLSSLLDADDPPDEERDRISMEMELEHMRQAEERDK